MACSHRMVALVGCVAVMAAAAPPVHAQAGYGQPSYGQPSYGQATYGQAPPPVQPAGRPTFRTPGSYERVSGRNNPALAYFGGGRSLQSNSSTRTQHMPAPQPVQTAAYMKPYAGFEAPPSVSPFLALDQRETESSMPNYYLFVKPALDQYSSHQAQQLQNRRMQQQLRRATTAGIMPKGTSGGMPTTGHSTQFMNSGGFYPTLQR